VPTSRSPTKIRWLLTGAGAGIALTGCGAFLVQAGPCGDRNPWMMGIAVPVFLFGGLLALKGLWPFLRG